jgi:hypothetical protein
VLKLREADVEHLHVAVGPHLDVRGLEVAAEDDALLVRGLERLGDLVGNRKRLGNRKPVRWLMADS